MTNISPGLKKAEPIIKHFENCHLKAYPDPKTGARPYTVGWGSTRNEAGLPFKLGEVITQARADSLFWRDCHAIERTLAARVPYYRRMAPDMQGALISFAYNLGEHFYNAKGFATISRNLTEIDWDKIPQTLMLYTNKGTAVEAGLRRRRTEEGKMWTQGLRRLYQQDGQLWVGQ
jgi:GH24 family phage-related lysozyme (muramidase)